jgi:hypothetical protein
LKPLVSALNAWTWFAIILLLHPFNDTKTVCSIVISVFAIVILSVLGALFKVSRHAWLLLYTYIAARLMPLPGAPRIQRRVKRARVPYVPRRRFPKRGRDPVGSKE